MNRKSSGGSYCRTNLKQHQHSTAYMIPTEIRDQTYLSFSLSSAAPVEGHFQSQAQHEATCPLPSRELHMWSSLIIPHENTIVRTEESTPALKVRSSSPAGSLHVLWTNLAYEIYPANQRLSIFLSCSLERHSLMLVLFQRHLKPCWGMRGWRWKLCFKRTMGRVSQNCTSALALSTSHIAARRGNIPHLIKSAAKQL